MILDPLQIIAGIFCLIFVSISIFVGLFIISKYFKAKNKNLLYVGITWICLSEIWWSSSFSFVSVLLTGQTLTPEVYFLIGNLFVPVGLILWITAMGDLVLEKIKKQLQIAYIIIAFLYYGVFMYFIATDVSVIGEMRGPIDGIYTPFALIFLLTGLFTFVITALIFAQKSLKSGDPDMKLKGKLLTIAIVFFLLGAALDGLKPFMVDQTHLDVFLLVNRIFLSFCAIAFYGGFILPKWMEKLLRKSK